MRASTQGRNRASLLAGLLAVPACALLWAGGGAAHAQTTTIADPAATDPAEAPNEQASDQTGAPDESRKPQRLRLRLEDVAPQKVFFKGSQPATFEYELAGSEKRDVVIEVVPKGGSRAAQRWTRDNVEPGTTQTQTWGGKKRSKGAAKAGKYVFRVREQGGGLADRSKADGDRSFGYYDHVFPIRGKHTYGDGLGAPRRGHRHQGVDVFAKCGTPLESARAGKVQFKGFQGGGAGYYVVIDGKKTGRDYVYMHLRGKAEVGEGERVRTGQRIGEVGESGNASGCHLHFELWSKPGWYQGGRILNPMKKLKKWDSWS